MEEADEEQEGEEEKGEEEVAQRRKSERGKWGGKKGRERGNEPGTTRPAARSLRAPLATFRSALTSSCFRFSTVSLTLLSI